MTRPYRLCMGALSYDFHLKSREMKHIPTRNKCSTVVQRLHVDPIRVIGLITVASCNIFQVDPTWKIIQVLKWVDHRVR